MAQSEFHLSFYVLCAVLGWLALKGILGGRTMFEFPAVAAMMGLAWVVPQGIELEANPYNGTGSEAFWLYVTACFLFIAWGFRLGVRGQRTRIALAADAAPPVYDPLRLILAAAGLTAVGQLSVFMMGGVDTSHMGGQWTGIITMYALFAGTSGMGLCLAVLIFARTRSIAALAIAAVAALPLLDAALLGVRREQLFDLIVLSAGSWYLARRSHPPRIAVIACLILGTVILNKASELRNYVHSGEGSFVEALLSGDLYAGFDYFELGQGEASEVGLAQYDFWFMNETDDWEYGADYWNKLVHQYVPAFLLGRDVKEDLKLDSLSRRLRLGLEEGAFSPGSTRTGFSDTYRSFALFGVLVFAAIGYGFGVLYAIAGLGQLAGQYYYLVLLAEGLKAITHSTGELLSALPFVLLVSLLVFRFARKPSGQPGRVGSWLGPPAAASALPRGSRAP